MGKSVKLTQFHNVNTRTTHFEIEVTDEDIQDLPYPQVVPLVGGAFDPEAGIVANPNGHPRAANDIPGWHNLHPESLPMQLMRLAFLVANIEGEQ